MAIKKLSPETLRRHKGISFVGVATSFICYNDQGEIFLAKRSRNARDEHGRWDLGGGGLKQGSSAIDNLRREIKEEYNATALDIEFLGYRDVFRSLDDGTPTHWISLEFAVRVDPAEVKINEPDMFDDSGWFRRNDLPSPAHSQLAATFSQFRPQLDRILRNR